MSGANERARDGDPENPLHIPRESNASVDLSPVDDNERNESILGTAVEHHKEQFLIISMSCTVCQYEITCGTRRLAASTLHNHQCIRQPRDSNNNLEEGTQDISYRVPEKKELMDPDDDVLGNVCDANDTEDSGSGLDTRNDVEWVRDYERFSGDIVWNGENGDNMKDGRAVVSQDGMTQWYCQVVTDRDYYRPIFRPRQHNSLNVW